MNPLSVTVAIAAYNAEGNIKHMLEALASQRQNSIEIECIIVCTEGSTDQTESVARSVPDARIKLLSGSQRHGFAGAVRTILAESKSQVTVLLNDDIKIVDDQLIEKLAVPFAEDPTIGLVAGNPQPLPPRSFIERTVVSGYKVWDETRSSLGNIHSALTADGKVLAVSQHFARVLPYPRQLSDMGCVDSYLFMVCVSQGFNYRWIKEARVYFRAVSTWHDYFSLQIRNNSNQRLLKKQFGPRVDREYGKPLFTFLRSIFKEFLVNPLGVLLLFPFGFYTRWKSRSFADNFNPLWEVVTTSKNLD